MDAFSVCEKDRMAVRALFGVSKLEVKRRVAALKEWIDARPDLPPEAHDEHFLDTMMLRAKFRMDFARTNILNYFKTLARYPEIFTKLGQFTPSQEVAVAVAVPNLTPAFERINVLKLSPQVLANQSLDLDRLVQVVVSTGVLFFLKDYVASARFVLDFTGVSFRDLFRVNIRTLFKLVHITEDMLRTRISGIELYNAPRIISPVLGIARILLKPKMLDRVFVHNDLVSLQDTIPVQCLPRDYGGDAEHTSELIRKFDDLIEQEQPLFRRLAILSRPGRE